MFQVRPFVHNRAAQWIGLINCASPLQVHSITDIIRESVCTHKSIWMSLLPIDVGKCVLERIQCTVVLFDKRGAQMFRVVVKVERTRSKSICVFERAVPSSTISSKFLRRPERNRSFEKYYKINFFTISYTSMIFNQIASHMSEKVWRM